MPLHRWVGSKRAIVADLFKFIPKPGPGGALIIPFYGGGSDSHYAIENDWATRYELADINPVLITANRVCRYAPGLLVEKLIALKNQCYDIASTKALYLQTRASYVNKLGISATDPAVVELAAQFIFLVQCGFNGLWRENSKGRNNVPFGQRLFTFDEEAIFATSKLLNSPAYATSIPAVSLNCMSYEYTIDKAQRGDVIYCDPPYIPTSATSSFASYGKNVFNLAEHGHLYEACLRAVKRGARAFVSNSNTEMTRQTYGCYRDDCMGNPRNAIHHIEAPRTVSAKASGRGTVTELLIEVCR